MFVRSMLTSSALAAVLLFATPALDAQAATHCDYNYSRGRLVLQDCFRGSRVRAQRLYRGYRSPYLSSYLLYDDSDWAPTYRVRSWPRYRYYLDDDYPYSHSYGYGYASLGFHHRRWGLGWWW
jgi:hypothetical protein